MVESSDSWSDSFNTLRPYEIYDVFIRRDTQRTCLHITPIHLIHTAAYHRQFIFFLDFSRRYSELVLLFFFLLSLFRSMRSTSKSLLVQHFDLVRLILFPTLKGPSSPKAFSTSVHRNSISVHPISARHVFPVHHCFFSSSIRRRPYAHPCIRLA